MHQELITILQHARPDWTLTELEDAVNRVKGYFYSTLREEIEKLWAVEMKFENANSKKLVSKEQVLKLLDV